MFHVKVASLKLPVVIIYDALSPEIDLFENGSLCEFWKIASAPERNFSGDPPGAFAVHTQLGKYNHRHRLHHHNQHKHEGFQKQNSTNISLSGSHFGGKFYCKMSTSFVILYSFKV